jgi:hypothetical protein
VAEVGQWLHSLGLGLHVRAFENNSINGTCLAIGLDEKTLTLLGVTLPVHQTIITRSLTELML